MAYDLDLEDFQHFYYIFLLVFFFFFHMSLFFCIISIIYCAPFLNGESDTEIEFNTLDSNFLYIDHPNNYLEYDYDDDESYLLLVEVDYLTRGCHFSFASFGGFLILDFLEFLEYTVYTPLNEKNFKYLYNKDYSEVKNFPLEDYSLKFKDFYTKIYTNKAMTEQGFVIKLRDRKRFKRKSFFYEN